MLWPSDTNDVTVFYNDGSQELAAEQWDGHTGFNDAPPAGLFAPKRGFAWVWHNHPGVADKLGWATTEERGFCAHLQRFERGFAFRSITTPCSSEFNRASEPGFVPLFIVVTGSGSWSRH